jgi:hypothetical protein
MLGHMNKKHRWASVATLRMQESYARKAGKKNVRVSKEWSWDTAMPDIVLKKHREAVLRCLDECLKDGLVVPGEQSEGSMNEQPSCVLVLRSAAESPSNSERSLAGPACPRYDLTTLLDTEGLSSLRGRLSEAWREEAQLLVLKDARTVKLQLALLRLQAYLDPQA